MKKKRIVVISDTHCGHLSGLTPPAWQITNEQSLKFSSLQSEMWNWYKKTLKALQPIDILFHLGDNIDGRGEKSGGTELITSDQFGQCAMAVRCIKEANAKKVVMVYGTPYHVSAGYQDFEMMIAHDVNAKISGYEEVDVNGTIFSLRHKIGNSTVPHGKGTALAKQWLWNRLWSEQNLKNRCDVFLRGHVHNFNYIGNNDFLAMSLPALEWSTKFGSRQCDGIVGLGIMHFDVTKGGYTWQLHEAKLKSQKVQLLKL